MKKRMNCTRIIYEEMNDLPAILIFIFKKRMN